MHAFLECGCTLSQAFDRLLAVRLQQVVLLEKTHQAVDVCKADCQGSFRIDGFDQALSGFLRPAQQQLEIEPADTKETVIDRILDHPGGRAVAIGGGR